jgi:hypothetical protein
MAGTVAVIMVGALTVNLAVKLPSFTLVAVAKPEPVMVTVEPACPEVGVNEVIVGVTVKLPVLVALPPGVVTVIGPVVAAFGAVAVMLVGELTL